MSPGSEPGSQIAMLVQPATDMQLQGRMLQNLSLYYCSAVHVHHMLRPLQTCCNGGWQGAQGSSCRRKLCVDIV